MLFRVNPTPGRPSMPENYGLPPIDDQAPAIAFDGLREKIANARGYWLCTVSPAGLPHVMPIWAAVVGDDLLFSIGTESRKERNLRANPILVIHLESTDDVVVIEGRAERATNRATLQLYEQAYNAKYGASPDIDDPSGIIFRVIPTKAFTWTEDDFLATARKWTFSPDGSNRD